jgi:replication initiation and membrane attachment protein DnaB
LKENKKMPVTLSSEMHDNIYEEIKNAFSDFALFDKLVGKQLQKVIAESNNVEIDMKTTRKVTDRYFDVDLFQTDQQKALLTQIQLILKTTYVLILSYYPESQKMTYKSIDELLEHYPSFTG